MAKVWGDTKTKLIVLINYNMLKGSSICMSINPTHPYVLKADAFVSAKQRFQEGHFSQDAFKEPDFGTEYFGSYESKPFLVSGIEEPAILKLELNAFRKPQANIQGTIKVGEQQAAEFLYEVNKNVVELKTIKINPDFRKGPFRALIDKTAAEIAGNINSDASVKLKSQALSSTMHKGKSIGLVPTVSHFKAGYGFDNLPAEKLEAEKLMKLALDLGQTVEPEVLQNLDEVYMSMRESVRRQYSQLGNLLPEAFHQLIKTTLQTAL